MKKILIVGAGAIGGSLAAYLGQTNSSITIYERQKGIADEINRAGVTLTGDKAPLHAAVMAVSDLRMLRREYDVCFLATRAYQLQDLLLTQQAVLHAMLDFGKTAVQTRGSALYPHPQGKLRKNLDELFRFRPDDGKTLTMIQQVRFADGIWTVSWRPTRPIPSDDDFFENVWRQYQDNRNIY